MSREFTVDGPRQNGTVLCRVSLSDEQYAYLRGISKDAHQAFIEGLLRGDDGFIYAWKIGHTYRDFTTPEKTQPGCRVSFAESGTDPVYATGISWHLVESSK